MVVIVMKIGVKVNVELRRRGWWHKSVEYKWSITKLIVVASEIVIIIEDGVRWSPIWWNRLTGIL